jgi:uncharacterized protein (TIGR03067 family)
MYPTLLIFAALATAAGDGDKPNDLQGTWNLITCRLNNGVAFRMLESGELTFEGNRYTQSEIMRFRGTIKWDETRQPKRFERTSDAPAGRRPLTRYGIYRLEGDTYTECTSAPGTKEPPSEFEAKPGSRVTLDVWKRARRRGVPVTATDADRLEGTWTLVSRVISGMPSTEEGMRGFTETFRGGRYVSEFHRVLHGTFKLGREGYRGGEIDLLTSSDTSLKGNTSLCVYQRKGYFLRLRTGSKDQRAPWFGEDGGSFFEYLYERADRPDLGPGGVEPEVGYALGVNREGQFEFRHIPFLAKVERRTVARHDETAAPKERGAAQGGDGVGVLQIVPRVDLRYPLTDLRVYDREGRRVPKEKVAGLLAKPGPILFTWDGYLVEPEYLRLAREGTPFVVLPNDPLPDDPAPAPASPPPPPAPAPGP